MTFLIIYNRIAMKIPGKRPFDTILKKISKLNLNQRALVNSEIKSKKGSVVAVDLNTVVYKKTKKTFSVKFINYIEPYEIGGVRLTMFYTEVDHNLEKGDRVFIVGGNFDSDNIITNNKFHKNADGYIVQYVDRTKVVLDIEFIDTTPWNQDPVDNFLKIYVASTQEDFDYFLSNLSGSGNIISGSDRLLSSRFSYDSVSLTSNNNILYVNGTFSVDEAIKYFIPGGTFQDSFLVYELYDATNSAIQGTLLDISSDILSGLHMNIFPYSQNERMIILNDTFTKDGTKFKENQIYVFNATSSKWEIDKTYMPAFICEQNFRDGRLIRGTYNQGILGNGINEIEYSGNDVEFNLGTILSVNWNAGSIGIGQGNSNSYFTEYDGSNLPSIKVNAGNNAGFGYNYAYFTNFFNGSFGNGTFINSLFGSPSASNAVYNHVTGNTLTYSVQTTGGNYVDSRIEFGKISESLLTNSEVVNSEIVDSKSVNSEFEKSIFRKSKYLSDKIIKIEGYSEHVLFRIHAESFDSIKRFRLLKFYMSEKNFTKIKAMQNFYFSGLEFSGGFSNDILNFFDDRFTIGDYFASDDRMNSKIEKNYVVQISTKEDNKYVPSGTQSTGFSVQMSLNTSNPYPSLDLMIIDGLESFSGIDYMFFDVSTINLINGSTIEFIVDGSLLSTSYVAGPNPGFYDLIDYLNQNYSFVIDTILGYDDNLGSLYTDNILVESIIIDGFTCSSSVKSGPKMDFSNGYILDSDFKSGIFEDSDWITGNYINHNKDNTISTTSSYYFQSTIGTGSGDPVLEISINDFIRYNIFGEGDVVFLNSIYYDTILNGGGNIVKLGDSYLVNQITETSGGRTLQLIDALGTYSVIWNVPPFTNQDYLISKNSENSYGYVHPVKFLNSRIESGIFRRSYFDGCLFKNKEFDSSDRETTISNSRKLLVTDTIFDDNDNDIRSGVFRYSHFVAGSDTWDGGILYNSLWNRESFTYSNSATSSEIFTISGSPFKNGVVKKSRWVWGEFDNGLFLNNKSNQIGTQSVYSEIVPVHWRKDFATRYSWINGKFNGGQFEASNWEYGEFKDGELFNSNFFGGIGKGGFFGRRNVPYNLTKILSGSFSNLNVINAEFRTQDPTGLISSTFSIEWYSGKFQNGLFGVLINDIEYELYELSYPFYSTWYGGEFNGGEFSDTAKWINGKFNGGKFTSYYGYPFIPVSDYISMSQSSFAWQGGEFNGGEFGNFSTSSNATWYGGEFNGGIFSGKYWKNGVFTKGSFIGSGTSSTTLSNIPSYVSDFSDYFYGLWENGHVTELKEKVITDKKFFTKLEREFTKKKRRPNVEFSGSLWRGGTFSHSDGLMKNSVWLDGTFEKGTFRNSSFNPYVNYIENSNFQTLDGWEINYSDIQPTGADVTLTTNPSVVGYNNLVWTGTSSVTIAYQTSGLIVGEVYSLTLIVNDLEDAFLRYGNWTNPINGNFNNTNDWLLLSDGSGTVSITTGQPGYVQMSGGISTDFSEIIYPGILEVGMTYTVTINAFDISGSAVISFGSSGYVDPYTQDLNIDLSSIIPLSGNGQYMSVITAVYPDLNLRFSASSGVASAKMHGIICTQNFELIANGPFPTQYNLTFSAVGPDFGIEIYGDSSNVTGSGVDWSSEGSANIQFVELVKGESGFNLSDTCIWKNGNFDESEFFISTWENGKWISGTGQGMIWKNGVANYMNAYNIYWEGGLWRNGNWNGAPFNLNNISASQSFVSPGFTSDILTNISIYRQEVGDPDYQTIFINNAFTQSSDTSLLVDPELDNGQGSAPNQSIIQDTNGSIDWIDTGWYPRFTYSGGSWMQILPMINAGTSVIGSSSSKRLYAKNATDTYIFDSIEFQYDIEIVYLAQYGPTLSSPSIPPELTFRVKYGIDTGFNSNNGNTHDITAVITNVAPVTFTSNYFGQTKLETLNYTFAPTNIGLTGSSNARRLYIQKLSSDPLIKLYILKIDIRKKQLLYDHNYNNMTYSTFGITPSYSDVLTLPNVEYLGGFNSGGQVSIQFGNGVFTSGTFSSVWENGVWNQGLRYDRNIVYFSNLRLFSGTTKPLAYKGSVVSKGSNQRSYEMSVSKNIAPNPNKVSFKSTTWILTLQVSDSSITTENGHLIDQIGIDLRNTFKVGDRVSVGNIIAIDINENRRLIRDSLTIIKVDEDFMSVQFTVNFPIRRVERDSDYHFIYVTKNIWLNGAFLNGIFRGVWNNGLFRGYPYITKMIDSEWIDGRFEGGRFRGITMSVTDMDTTSQNINSGLIQNFQSFKDQDTSILPFTHSYNSWIDVNYYTYSSVTIGRNTITYDPTYGEYAKTNFYRYPTYDVLRSSKSEIRNNYDEIFNNYSLGHKYKDFTDFLYGLGTFENYYNNSSIIGISNLTSDGWTWDALLLDYPNYITASITSNDDNSFDTDELKMKVYLPSSSDLTATILDNTKRSDFKRNRYSYTSFNLDKLLDGDIIATFDPEISSISPNINLSTRSTSIIKEYHYNNRKLLIFNDHGPTSSNIDPYEAIISELKFVETDSIPFFQLATESNINQSIASPLQAQAPFIDYSNNNFSLIDSLNISETIFITIPSSPNVGSGGVIQNKNNNISVNNVMNTGNVGGGFINGNVGNVFNPSPTPPPPPMVK